MDTAATRPAAPLADDSALPCRVSADQFSFDDDILVSLFYYSEKRYKRKWYTKSVKKDLRTKLLQKIRKVKIYYLN